MSNINISSTDGVKGIRLEDVVHSKMDDMHQKFNMRIAANNLRIEREKADALMNMMENKGNQVDQRC